jgi:hypothetical protein
VKRASLINGVVLMVLLGLSWHQWTSEPEVDRGHKVELFAGDLADISVVRWAGVKSEATLTRKSDAKGDYTWIESVRWSKKPRAKASGEEDAPVAEPERVAKRSVFKASDKADQLFEDLSPMLALRRLEVSDPDKLEELGLTSPKATLEIVRGGQTQALDIGGESYGSRHIYVQRRSDGAVYLVERELLASLKSARSRLADRRLIGLARKDLVRALITADGESLDATQQHADDKDRAVWVLSSDPESAPEQLTSWMTQALKLIGMRYADPADSPADLQSRLTVQFFGAKGESEILEVLQVGKSGDWYARSEHTRGLVKLTRSSAKSLADDVQSVIESAD